MRLTGRLPVERHRAAKLVGMGDQQQQRPAQAVGHIGWCIAKARHKIDLDAVAAAEPVDSDGAPVDEAVEVEAELEPQTETASEETPAMLRAEDV